METISQSCKALMPESRNCFDPALGCVDLFDSVLLAKSTYNWIYAKNSANDCLGLEVDGSTYCKVGEYCLDTTAGLSRCI
jgi:hypothetical protein